MPWDPSWESRHAAARAEREKLAAGKKGKCGCKKKAPEKPVEPEEQEETDEMKWQRERARLPASTLRYVEP